MAVEARQETREFQTEVRQLLDLMIHSLYSNKEIFLRELISNASDAADKLRFEALQNDSLYEGDAEFKIRVEYDKKQKTINVIDNGIGMSRDEIIDHLGTIAKSGTRQFFESLTGDQSKDAQLIGQFGVGFYSSFIVAEKVEVSSRRAGLPRTEGVRWTSSGAGEYTVETLDRPKRGTKVVLYLRNEAKEFLDGFRLRSIIKRYSDHISLPIVMLAEGQDAKGEETVNTATALWTRNKKDIKDEEYQEFYKHVSHDFQPPLTRLHHKVEGKLEYTSLLFIPAHAPFDLWDRQQRRHGVKLYVKRVFIMDDAEQLVPSYLRFIRGIVDSDDLPLNISREILQHNKTIDAIRSGCTKKILGLLRDMARKEPDKYNEFWKEFGRVLKEGIIEEADKREDLAKLFRFSSTLADREEQTVSLEDYVGRMQKDQKAIYYINADSFATAKNSPHLEIFRKKGIEVLLMSDPIDEWVMTHPHEFAGKPLQSVMKGELDLGDEKEKKDGKIDLDNNDMNDLTDRIKKVLESRVKDVRTTQRLTSSPACLVADEHDMGRTLERILKASGQKIPASKPILEINPEHPVIERMKLETDESVFADWSNILFEQSLLSEGGQLDDPAGFVQRLNHMFLQLGGKHS